MFIEADTLDDILYSLYPKLLASQVNVRASRGINKELLGVLISLRMPRARLSRTETRGRLFSCLGELLWYLSGSNDLEFIRSYIPRYVDESEDEVTVYGGYGPRLFAQRGNNQIENVISLLRRNPNSRRAVVQLFDAEDLSRRHREIPCTLSLQFLIRDSLLHMIVNMRSNDAYMGLPHDIFCFTMIQEIVCRSIDVGLGTYRHFVGSLHLYDEHWAAATQYTSEGVQERIEMPEMPTGDPWPAIRTLLDAEERIRLGEIMDANAIEPAAYWSDLIRMLQTFRATGDSERIDELKAAMHFRRYSTYIDARKTGAPRPPFQPRQLRLSV